MFSSEVRRNKKVKLNALQNGYLGYLIFLILTPQIRNFNLSKIIAYKIRSFQVIQKTGIYVIEVQTTRISNFKQHLCFWMRNSQKKTGKGEDVTFFNAIFGISSCRT